LNEYLTLPIRAIVDWAADLFSPSDLLARCLQENATNGFRGVIGKFWTVPIGLTILFDAGFVFAAFGFDLQSGGPAFALYVIYTSLKWFIGAAVVALLLRLFRQTSNLNIVVACYTFIVAYAPIFSLLESPGLFNRVSAVSELKAHGVSLIDAINLILTDPKKFVLDHPYVAEETYFFASTKMLLWHSESAIFLIVSVFVAENLAALLLNDKFRTYLVVWLASVVSVFPVALLNLIWVVVEWRQGIGNINIPN
jgi:hypothetical protein